MNRSKAIGLLLLHRAIHSSQHFYTFIPSNTSSRFALTLNNPNNKFRINIHRNKCDLSCNESNSYLFNLLQYNMGLRFNTIPESVIEILQEIASSSLDFAYINTSQAYFTVCDVNGNKISPRDSRFYLFIVFLHNFSNSSSAGQQFVKLDSFFLSPSFFNCSTLVKASEVRTEGHIPQEAIIQNLFKSCFLYTLYHCIIENNTSIVNELRRFLTADNCSSSKIDIDLSPLLQILPYLNEDECRKLDDDVIDSIDPQLFSFFDEYFLVNCPEYPCFIRLTLSDPSKPSAKQAVWFDCFLNF